jgi:hypothetical protein
MEKRLERAIHILAISFIMGQTIVRPACAEQPKVRPVGRVVVADGNGKIVGAALGSVGVHVSEVFGPSDVRPTVLLQVDQHLAAVHVARDRLYGGRLWFTSEDCTGMPWFPFEPIGGAPLPLLPQSAIAPPGWTLYLQIPNVAPQSIAAKSFLTSGAQCTSADRSLDAVLAQPLVDLLTIFTPPFSLRAAP